MAQPPPVLIVYAHEWRSMMRLAGHGEAWAKRQLAGLFDSWYGEDVKCGGCRRDIDHWPPYGQIVPLSQDHARLGVVPLCPICAERPIGVRINLALSNIRAYLQQSQSVGLAFTPPKQQTG